MQSRDYFIRYKSPGFTFFFKNRKVCGFGYFLCLYKANFKDEGGEKIVLESIDPTIGLRGISALNIHMTENDTSTLSLLLGATMQV